MIEYFTGDLFHYWNGLKHWLPTDKLRGPDGGRAHIIAHVCNNRGGWGRGFSGAVSKQWSAPEREYRRMFEGHNHYQSNWRAELGTVDFVEVSQATRVCNMIAQDGYSSRDKPALNYDALAECLLQVRHFALANQAQVHMPKIGCGLGGGQWSVVEALVRENLSEHRVSVRVYSL